MGIIVSVPDSTCSLVDYQHPGKGPIIEGCAGSRMTSCLLRRSHASTTAESANECAAPETLFAKTTYSQYINAFVL